MCTHWTTYINPGVGQVSVAAHEGALLSKCGTGIKPQRDSPAAWRGNQIPHPEVTHSLTQPRSLTPPNLPSLPPLGCTHPCRCRVSGPRRCHSCTPGLYGGHRAVLRGSPGWAERHTPCSSRSHLGQSWLLGDRTGAPLDTHTPLGSLRSPTAQEVGIILKNCFKRDSFLCKRTGEDNSLTHVTQITGIPQCVCGLNLSWIPCTVPEPCTDICNSLSPSAWDSPGEQEWKGRSLVPQNSPPPCSCSFCFSPPITPHTHQSHCNNSQ